MTPRAARLVAAAAVMAWCAAALSWLAPSLPAGLGAACAPGLVARELLALLVVMALLVVPSFTADEPGRPREDHAGGLAALAGLPAVAALHMAGGGEAAALLPAAALLLAADLAASSFLRLDPAGRRAVPFAAAAAALLAGIPVAAWGAAELGGWEGASLGFRLSPLLAIRDLAGGWGGMAPALLLLVAAAAVLRLGGLRARPAAAAALLLVLLGGGRALAAVPAPAGEGPVLVVGGAREGPVADLEEALRARGLGVVSRGDLPDPLPAAVETVLLARAPADGAETLAWTRALRPFLRAGGGAAAAPGPAADLLAGLAEPGMLGLVETVDAAGAAPAAERLARRRTLLPPPGAGPGDGVAPDLFRVPFPSPARRLPGRVLAFLAVLAAGFAGAALGARRRGLGQARAGGALALLAAVGSALLFLPGLAPDASVVARVVLEERASARAPTGRRWAVGRVERTAAGEGTAAPDLAPGTDWTEVLYEAGAARAFEPPGTVRLAGPGRWALLSGVSGVDTPPPAGPFLAALRVREGRAWEAPGADPGAPPGEGPGVPLEAALAAWRGSDDPRVARAGRLFGAALRAGEKPFTLAVPAAGVDGIVLRE